MSSPLRVLTENWQLKALALALALMLWVVVSAEEVTSSWIPVPVRIEENDPGYELVAPRDPGPVEVRFTGSGRDLMQAAIRKPPIVLTIDRVQGTTQQVRLEPSMVQIPAQLPVSAQEIRSPTIDLSFRRLASRTLSVRPVLDGQIESGYTLSDSLTLAPSRIEVNGPADRVETLTMLRTMPFALPAADSTFSILVPVDTSELAGLELSVPQVRVSGRVDRVVQRRLSGVPVSVGPGISIRPERVDVLLTGPRSAVEVAQPMLYRVVVAIDTIPGFIPPEGVPVPLRLEQPRRGITATLQPPTVRLMPAVLPVDSVAEAEAQTGG